MTESDSELTNKNQMSLEEYEYELSISENEKKLHEQYLKEILPKTSPIKIPRNSTCKEEPKQGYHQIKYKWQDAITARKNGTITKEQEEMLKNGHWKG